ncbi:histone H1-like [Pseudorasbora parva]|uniref:histone H1-like n=1 Tax=Pseudorasbora parva TaxID=51549 RepID=UPI00351E3146
MAEIAPEAAETTAAKKKSPTKRLRISPGVRELIVKAVSASQERSGVSLPALKKALAADGYNVEKNNSRIKFSLNNLVSNDILVLVKGTGASGSFRLNKKHAEAKKAAPKAKKPAAAKAKAAAVKKAKAAKKSPKKAKKPAATAAKKATRSPKKAKKPAAAKKAAKSPKKAKAAKPKAAKPKAAKPKRAAPKKR